MDNSDSEYVDISKCDVEDKQSLASYRRKRAHWIHLLSGDKTHSVQRQIIELLWDDTVYRTFGQILELYPENSEESAGYNGTLMNLFIRNFFRSQSSRIRCLIDARGDVISLSSLINDVAKNALLLTRENYVCFDGERYDTSQLEADHLKRLLEQRQPSWVSKDILVPKIRHTEFDRLCGTDETKRSRTDTVKAKEIRNLNKWSKCEAVQGFVNKFVAHASTEESRQNVKVQIFELSLDMFDECYIEVAKAAISIGRSIGETIAWQVPTPQMELFTNLEKPMAKKADIKKLRNYWDERVHWVSDIEQKVLARDR